MPTSHFRFSRRRLFQGGGNTATIMREIYWGNSLIHHGAEGGTGEFVQRDGERFYKITNYHEMPPFFITIVSGSDHWMFLSSTGGLTCGRGNPENALFPYYTDDKIHDAHSTTGPQTVLLAEKEGKTYLWKPFAQEAAVYSIERNLYKNQPGNKIIFEEINHDLALVFSYSWSSSEQFGFVKKSKLENVGSAAVRVELLDGLRNLLPYGVTQMTQATLSTLLDGYKQAEVVPGLSIGIYTLSSILTDRAEPSEALKATVVWSTGLDQPQLLLSEDQVEAFCSGATISNEVFSKGKRGAFYVQSSFQLPPGAAERWHTLADINQGPSQVAALLEIIRTGISPETIEQDSRKGTHKVWQLAGSSDGCQFSSDPLLDTRHFSNTLFNIMRGGVFYDGYNFPFDDFLDFVSAWNAPLRRKFEALLESREPSHTLDSVLAAAANSGDADMERIALEYLPLTFSRRHGDPSRPWNHFSIDIKNPDGSDKLYYQGNWRDIFQNWEALAISYPEYIESFIAKFVNASTADGYNPYRIATDGVDWETLDEDSPWSNIGYWGDHQINYLLKLLELSQRYHPGKITGFLAREIFVYANVPYRIKGYKAQLGDPRNTVEYDDAQARLIAMRTDDIGSDGKLLALEDGSICKVNLLEKLLVSVLSKIGNFVPGGGIWMNTQRPEWNDANNALVGYGLSMVTLCYLRRFLVLLAKLLSDDAEQEYSVSIEVLSFFSGIEVVLKKNQSMLESTITAQDRKAFMDDLGVLAEQYRSSIYAGLSGEKASLDKSELLAFIGLALNFMNHSITLNRRVDGLFHSYNLIHFGDQGFEVENLYEMLEGQVAVLSSDYLEPQESLALLTALRESRIYRADQNSYMLYPYRKLPLFLAKNIIGEGMIEHNFWIRKELKSGRRKYVEQDVNGVVHFNGDFRNAGELRAALLGDSEISAQDRDALCHVYETVFKHRQFTGRSGSMYKYEGLGCIYWHMVSKLLLATEEVIVSAVRSGADEKLLDGLIEHFEEIQDGLGVHNTPAQYGAFPFDPYSHTPAFAGVQQPGMTGQVKEDLITRFGELGVRVNDGEITFAPILLKRSEFTSEPETWRYSPGGAEQLEELDSGSLAFTLCGVPIIYRLATSSAIRVFESSRDPHVIQGNQLGPMWSQSIFRRETRVRRVEVDISEAGLRALSH